MTTQDLDNEFERSAASRAEAMPTEQDLAQIIADNERLRLAVERLTSAGLSAAQGEVAKEDELDYWIRSWTEKDVQNAALEKDNKRLRDALTSIMRILHGKCLILTIDNNIALVLHYEQGSQ